MDVVPTIPVLPVLGTLGLVAIVTVSAKAAQLLSDLHRQPIRSGAHFADELRGRVSSPAADLAEAGPTVRR
jgi:hypothetical protein